MDSRSTVQQLVRTQLVTRAQDRIGRVGRAGPHQLERAQHGRAIAGDRGTDARDDHVHAGHRPALVVHREAIGGDAHVAAQRVKDTHGVAARARRLDQPAGGIQGAVAGQDGELHRGGIGRQARSIARAGCAKMATPATGQEHGRLTQPKENHRCEWEFRCRCCLAWRVAPPKCMPRPPMQSPGSISTPATR
ncbi:hypothetical protein G6F32_014207 [Rhizopus arrhizus]|nr:hypothetical protein G6F32_014207 [Rhizopus arrhizus]